MQVREKINDYITTKDIAKEYGVARQRVETLIQKGQIMPEPKVLNNRYVWFFMPLVIRRKPGRPKKVIKK